MKNLALSALLATSAVNGVMGSALVYPEGPQLAVKCDPSRKGNEYSSMATIAVTDAEPGQHVSVAWARNTGSEMWMPTPGCTVQMGLNDLPRGSARTNSDVTSNKRGAGPGEAGNHNRYMRIKADKNGVAKFRQELHDCDTFIYQAVVEGCKGVEGCEDAPCMATKVAAANVFEGAIDYYAGSFSTQLYPEYVCQFKLGVEHDDVLMSWDCGDESEGGNGFTTYKGTYKHEDDDNAKDVIRINFDDEYPEYGVDYDGAENIGMHVAVCLDFGVDAKWESETVAGGEYDGMDYVFENINIGYYEAKPNEDCKYTCEEVDTEDTSKHITDPYFKERCSYIALGGAQQAMSPMDLMKMIKSHKSGKVNKMIYGKTQKKTTAKGGAAMAARRAAGGK